MSMPTGDYLIINGRYRNLAFLPDINKGTTVVQWQWMSEVIRGKK
jgi:hypothetical protein